MQFAFSWYTVNIPLVTWSKKNQVTRWIFHRFCQHTDPVLESVSSLSPSPPPDTSKNCRTLTCEIIVLHDVSCRVAPSAMNCEPFQSADRSVQAICCKQNRRTTISNYEFSFYTLKKDTKKKVEKRFFDFERKCILKFVFTYRLIV